MRTLLTVAIDFFMNLYRVLMLWLGIYMVDELFNKEKTADEKHLLLQTQEQTACLVGLLYVAPMVLLHMGDVCKTRMNLRGRTRTYLQANLFRKYLNYSGESRKAVDAPEMQMAILGECSDLSAAYMSVIDACYVTTKLIVLSVFTVLQNPSSKLVVVAMPLLMMTFAAVRRKSGQQSIEDLGEAMNKIAAYVADTSENYELIADYFQRPHCNDHFAKLLARTNRVETGLNMVRTNNNYWPKWLGPLFTGAYIAFLAPAVLAGDADLGVFLATIHVFRDMSDGFGEFYSLTMKVNDSMAPLHGLTILFNRSTDVRTWKEVNRRRRKSTTEERESILSAGPRNGSGEGQTFLTDLIPIRLSGVTFEYGLSIPVFVNVNLSVPQGKIVAVIGKHLSGKRTLLDLISHKLFPSAGNLFVPTHLRILRVAQEPSVLNLSCARNLMFGTQHARTEKEQADQLKRTREVLRKFRLLRELWPLVKENFGGTDSTASVRGGSSSSGESDSDEEPEAAYDGSKWWASMSQSTKTKLHLARAFIMNAEVMVMHRPLLAFHEEAENTIFQLMREHVDNRGLGMPSESMKKRRPRTVFYTPDRAEQALKADIVWCIKDHTVVEMQPSRIDKNQVKEGFDE